VLAIGADQPDFFGPNLFVDSMVFSGDVNFPLSDLITTARHD
jgi:hypothetical protein